MPGELVLNLGPADKSGAFQVTPDGKAFVSRTTDPVISPAPSTPIDFAAQFPQPLDTTELVTMCEEIGFWKNLPELPTSLKSETWRELNELAFTSGSSYISFADGACPEEYYHDGDNTTIDLKNIGAHKSLTISDILHSAAVSSMSLGQFGVGINRIVGGFQFSEGMPGGNDQGTFLAEAVSDLKAKEMVLAGTLVLNGWDNLLINGDAVNVPLEFSGLATLVTTANGAHGNDITGQNASGTFTGIAFDRYLAEGCAKPDTLVGHPQALQELMSAYFALGFQGSQIIYNNDGNRMVPGYNFAGEVNTGIGTLKVIADRNVAKATAGANSFSSSIFALRMRHNGEPLVYKRTQIPFSFRDLVPGCTAIQFQVWSKTALIVKAMCAQGIYRGVWTGRSVTTCPTI
jgi:hypothetical protein